MRIGRRGRKDFAEDAKEDVSGCPHSQSAVAFAAAGYFPSCPSVSVSSWKRPLLSHNQVSV
jgi:hypothetical protein